MAAGSGAIRAGRAFIEIFTEDSAVGRGLRAISGRMVAWGASVSALGSRLGSVITSTLSVMSSAAMKAGFAMGVLGAGLLGAANAFAQADRSTLSDEQASAADKTQASMKALKDTAMGLNAAFQTALQPTIEAIIDVVRIGMNAFRNWINTHQELLDGVNQFMSGIRNALSAGDIGLAANVLWAQLKVIWAQGIAALSAPWNAFTTAFRQLASDAFFGVMEIANNVWAGMRGAIAETTAFFTNAWATATNWVAKRFIDLQESLGIITAEVAEGARQDLDDTKGAKQAKAEADKIAALRKIESERLKAEAELVQQNIDTNNAIAAEGLRNIAGALEDKRKADEALQSFLDQAEAKRQEIPTGLQEAAKAAEMGNGSAAGAFAGSRSLGQLANDLPGKALDVAKKTASATERTAKAVEAIAAEGLSIGVT